MRKEYNILILANDYKVVKPPFELLNVEGSVKTGPFLSSFSLLLNKSEKTVISSKEIFNRVPNTKAVCKYKSRVPNINVDFYEDQKLCKWFHGAIIC